MISGGIAGTVDSGANAILGPVTNAAVQAWTREINYLANEANPNFIPSPGMLIDCLNKGLINRGAFDLVMKWNGIPLADPEQPTNTLAWNSVINATRIPLPLDFAYSLLGSGVWQPQDYAANARRRGITTPEEIQLSLDHQFLPSPSEVITNWLLGVIDWPTAQSILLKWGIGDGQKLDKLVQWSSSPGAAFGLDALRTRRLSEAEAIGFIKAAGIRAPKAVDLMVQQATQNVPSYNVISEIAQSGVTNADYAAKWGLLRNIPAIVTQLSDKSGAAGRPIDSNANAGPATGQSWGEVQWAASRQRFSRSEAAILLRRLGVAGLAKFSANVTGLQQFSQADYEQVLLANGFTVEQLPYVQALSYDILTARDIKRGLKFHQLTQQQAIDAYKDLGYIEADARLRATIDQAELDEADHRPIAGIAREAEVKLIKSVAQLYTDGIISQIEARDRLTRLGCTIDESQAIEAAAQAEFIHESIKESIEAVKHAYLSGSLSADECSLALATIGVQSNVIPLYLARWNVGRNLPHRTEQASAIVRFYGEGLLTQEQAVARLANLGVTLPDVTLLLAEANQKHQQLLARQQLAEQKHNAQAVAALKKIAASHLTAAQVAEKQATKIATPQRLQNWLSEGVIDDNEFIQTLKNRGVPEDVIMDLWNETNVKAAKHKGKAKGQSKPQA